MITNIDYLVDQLYKYLYRYDTLISIECQALLGSDLESICYRLLLKGETFSTAKKAREFVDTYWGGVSYL